jgi:hypothetical protein
VKLNGGTNVINVTPGLPITLTGTYNSVYSALYNTDGSEYCPGCITQLHIGMSDGANGNLFNDCIETNGGARPQPSGTLNKTFTAPTLPGVYYVTQESTWWFNCGQFADPVHSNAPTTAIAVVVVNESYSIPASPIAIQQLNRMTTYTDVKLNGGTNSINVAPGQSITLTGTYNSVYADPTNVCPACITQLHIGMNDGAGGNLFNDCIETNGSGNPSDLNYPKPPQPSGTLNRTFTAPTLPGTYYITQESTWWYYCGEFADPLHSNVPNNAIAVVVVNGATLNITASTTATSSSPVGFYPITLQGCTAVSPNYEVTLQDGTLSITSNNVIAGTKARSLNEGVINDFSSVDKLYPNPGSSLVKLELSDNIQRTEDIQLFDMAGKLTRISVRRAKEKMYEIDVSVLSKGVYLMKVKTSGGLKTFKFIKL